MCLTIQCKSRAEARNLRKNPFIAKEDIVVYKNFYRRRGVYESPYRGFIYERGYTYYQVGKAFSFTGEKNPYLNPAILEVNKGLHAYTSKAYARSRYSFYVTTIQCIIPKGSKYYKNSTEIVADQLIIP